MLPMGAGMFPLAVIRVEKDFDLTVEWPPLGGYGHGSSFNFRFSTSVLGSKGAEMQNSTSSGGKQTLSSEKQLLVTSNLALVGYVVSGLAMKLPTHIDRDELRSAGLEGLVQAAHSFAEDRGVPFRHFAALRIRGAIMDDLRRNDWASRSVRQAGRVREQAVDHLIATLGSAPKKASRACRQPVPSAPFSHPLSRGSVLAPRRTLPLEVSPQRKSWIRSPAVLKTISWKASSRRI